MLQGGKMMRRAMEDSQLEVEHLNLLLGITKDIVSELDLEKLLNLIMDRTRKALNADRCSVFLIDEKTRELWTIVAQGLKGKEIRIPADMGLVGHVASTGKILNVKDAYNDDRFDQSTDKKTGYKTKTILSMPLRNRHGITIGVFQILNKKSGVFTKEDETVLAGVGSIATIAVENARLYRDQAAAFDSCIDLMATATDERNPVSSGHSERVGMYARQLARQLEWEDTRDELLHYACLLHDFWNVGILEDYFMSVSHMSAERFHEINSITAQAKLILHQLDLNRDLVEFLGLSSYYYHNLEKRAPKKRIPEAEVIAFCDLFDMLTYEKPYKPRLPLDEVLATLEKELDRTIHKKVVRAFFSISLGDIMRIMVHGLPYRVPFKHLELFSGISLDALRKIITKKKPDERERDILDLFSSYYAQ